VWGRRIYIVLRRKFEMEREFDVGRNGRKVM
jgi:hypothetical protein